MLNQLNINQYMYNVYDEYLERYYVNAVNYSINNGLIIRYFKILVDESYNFDSETAIHTDYKNFKFALYDFVPIIDAQPPVSQVYFDPSLQGTSYNVTMTITITGIKNPLPGDLLHYYDLTGNKEIDSTEVFRVRHVNYIRSMNNKFPIYQLEIEYAPMKRSTLDQIAQTQAIKHFYWDNETNSFISADRYKYLIFLKDNRENLLNKIYTIYNEVKAGYDYCKLNSVFKIIQKNHEFPIKVISPDIEFIDYSLKDFLGYFSLYYKLKNHDPCYPNSDFPQVDYLLNNKINELSNTLENSKEIKFIDTNCEKKTDEVIFTIEKTDQIKFIEGNLFPIYDSLYKILFSYYMLNPEKFWNNSIIAHNLEYPIKIDNDAIFYDINGKFVKYEDILKEIKYDPGYALSYQNGAQYFSPVNTLGF